MNIALAAAALALAYLVGSVPLALLVARRRGIDLRATGSGNPGASNLWQTASRVLVVPVGLAQVGQGAAGVLIARALGGGDGLRVAGGLAAIIAYDWNPWLGFRGGRGVGPTAGFYLALAPFSALPAFLALAIAGVPVKQAPAGVAAGLMAAPLAALVRGEHAAIVAGCALVAAVALAKRLLANGRPDAGAPRPAVWLTRLVHDRDIADRDAWVRRGLAVTAPRR